MQVQDDAKQLASLDGQIKKKHMGESKTFFQWLRVSWLGYTFLVKAKYS